MERVRLRLDDDERALVESHMGLALSFARSRYRRARWVDREDLEGAAAYGLCLAAGRWRGECPFERFAARIIDIEIGQEIRRWKWGLRGEATIQFDEGMEYQVEATEADWSDGPVRRAFDACSDAGRFALDRVVIHGQTTREAAAQIGVCKNAVDKALGRAKAQLRDQLAATA